MILELYGLPGAGKTTWAKKLVAQSDFKIVTIGNKFEILFLNILFMIVHPIKSIGLLYVVLTYSTVLLRYKFIHLFLHHNAKYIKAYFFSNAIIDQGHFQNIISLFEKEVDHKILSTYMRLLCKPDALIVYDYETDIREQRLRNRGYGARDTIAGYDATVWKQNAACNFKRSLSLIPHAGVPFWVIRQDIEGDVLREQLIKRKYNIIHYVFRGRIPTEKAHGLQVAKMCEAFAQCGYAVVIHATYRKNSILENLFQFYGVQPIFAIKTYTHFGFMVYLMGTRIGFAIERFLWFIYWFVKSKRRRVLYYTRDEEIAYAIGVRAPVIVEVHNVTARVWKHKLLTFFLAKAYRVVCNSLGTEKAVQQLGIHRALSAPNGVSADTFVVTDSQLMCRQKTGLPIDKKIIMYVGKFYTWKGVDFLLQMWQESFIDKSDMVLVLVGGEKHDIDMLKTQYAHKNVIYIPPQKHTDVPLYLKAADVLVLPNISNTQESRDFTSPIKIYEYMASGTPVVASDLHSIKNLAADDEVVFFKHDNTESLKHAIVHACQESAELHDMVERARQRALAHTWIHRAEKIMDTVVYE